jgi:hypothetical protein
MRTLKLLALVALTSCAAQDPIFMKETAMRLTKVEKNEYPYRDNLYLHWQTLDNNIHIITEAPLEDSSLYKVGTIYSRCFLRR